MFSKMFFFVVYVCHTLKPLSLSSGILPGEAEDLRQHGPCHEAAEPPDRTGEGQAVRTAAVSCPFGQHFWSNTLSTALLDTDEFTEYLDGAFDRKMLRINF